MANPFDQFDEAKPTAAAPDPARRAPGSTAPAQPTNITADGVAAALGAPAPEAAAPNAFDNPVAPRPEPLSNNEMTKQYYKMLNDGATTKDIIDWSVNVAQRPLNITDAQMNAVTNDITYRDKQRDRGVKGDLFKDRSMLETDTRLTNPLNARDTTLTGDDMGAAVRKGANNVLFNFGDEIMSAIQAPFQSLSNGESISRNYRDNWLGYNAQNQMDEVGRPTADTVGSAMGIAGSVALPGMNTAGRTLLGRTLIGGAEGAVQGGLNATGEGTIDDRFGKTGEGALLGGGIGSVLPGAIDATGRVVRPVVERLPGADSAKALARRLGLGSDDIDELEAAAARERELVGDDSVALIDVLPEGGRNVVGTAGRQGTAREALQDVGEARAAAAPARIQNQADRISPETASPDELRSGINRFRDDEISAAMEPIRTAPLPLEQGVVDVLTTGTGLAAIRRAINDSEDVGVRNQLEELYAGLRDLRRSVDPRLPEATQQRLQGVSLEQLPFTIDMSDKISRALNEAEKYAFGTTVRDAARLSPRYREIMEDYGARSRASEAVGVGSGERTVMDEAGRVRTERSQGAGFLDENPDRYAARVDRLNDRPDMRFGEPPAPNQPLQNVEEYSHPDGTRYVNAEYVAPDGEPVRLMFKLDGEGRAFDVTVGNKGEGAGSPNDGGWDEVANTMGPGAVRDMLKAVKAQYPEITSVTGKRVTGASAGTDAANVTLRPANGEATPVVQITEDGVSRPAPSNRDLARAGAASTVREDPIRAARQIVGDPNQQRRLASTVGEEEAGTIRRAMDAELGRVRRVQQQVTQAGPRSEAGMGAEGVVNTLYNPGPISMGREALRFMNRIGMTDRDADWIVRNATDPAQFDNVIARLRQHGLDQQRAHAYADMLRTMSVRAGTDTEERR